MPDFRNADEPDCLQADEASALLQVGYLIPCQRRVLPSGPCWREWLPEFVPPDHRGAARGSC